VTRLRPARPEDADFLNRQNDPEAAGSESWWGFRATGATPARLASPDAIGETQGVLAVVDDEGSIVGDVSWIRMTNGPPPQGYCYNMGVWIAPEHRGKGHGLEAQRQLAAYLFEHFYLERVEASTDIDNVGEQRALEKAGFTREGVLRHAWFRAGAWRDIVMYSKLRGDA
jgi:RimJ/RimL family protein N-acetyltransferase